MRAPSKTAKDIKLRQHKNVLKDTSAIFEVMVNMSGELVNLFGKG